MLKTISHQEFEHFKFIMKSYYYHLLGYPHSLVARILGLHKIKLKRDGKTERIYFVIMANVFNTNRQIKVRYDLKGSTQGRETKPPHNSKVALKDLDWLKQNMDVNLRPEIRNLLISQLKQDAMFFQKGNINDYSILLGICDLEPGEAQEIEKSSPNFDMLVLEGIFNYVEEEKLKQGSQGNF